MKDRQMRKERQVKGMERMEGTPPWTSLIETHYPQKYWSHFTFNLKPTPPGTREMWYCTGGGGLSKSKRDYNKQESHTIPRSGVCQEQARPKADDTAR